MAENKSDYNFGDYNRGGYIAFIFSMAVTVLFFLYIAFIHPGVDLKEVEEQIQKDAQVQTEAGSEQGATPENSQGDEEATTEEPAAAPAEQPKDANAEAPKNDDSTKIQAEAPKK